MSVSLNVRQTFVLPILAVTVLGLVGCHPSTRPPPTPTLVVDPAETETPPAPTVTYEPTMTPVPTVTLPSTDPTLTPTSEAITYVVQEGDTLSGIALEYGITVDAIATANGLASEDIIYAGQELAIPLGTAQPPPSPSAPPTATASPYAVPSPVPGAAPRLPPIEPTFITHGDRTLPYIALTFDACQRTEEPSGYDEAIISILTETETPATLFLGGLWMQSHPTQTQSLAANPLFELGNHSWSHPDFAGISPEEMSAEVLLTQDMMYELTGRQPTLFRLPFGTYTDEALTVIAQHGLRTIQWDVVTGDPDPNISAEDIVNAVTTQAQRGSIVIMHMNTRGWHTAEALPTMIEHLCAQGYTFVTVSQLLGLAPLPPPIASEEVHE